MLSPSPCSTFLLERCSSSPAQPTSFNLGEHYLFILYFLSSSSSISISSLQIHLCVGHADFFSLKRTYFVCIIKQNGPVSIFKILSLNLRISPTSQDTWETLILFICLVLFSLSIHHFPLFLSYKIIKWHDSCPKCP